MRMHKISLFSVILAAFLLCLSVGEETARAQLASPLTSATGYDDNGYHYYTLSTTSPTVTSIAGTGALVEPGDDGR